MTIHFERCAGAPAALSIHDQRAFAGRQFAVERDAIATNPDLVGSRFPALEQRSTLPVNDHCALKIAAPL